MITHFRNLNRPSGLLASGIFAFAIICASHAIAGENNADDAMKQRARAEADADRADHRAVSTANRHLGRAPWICTPSGFGQTASCFRRGSVRMRDDVSVITPAEISASAASPAPTTAVLTSAGRSAAGHASDGMTPMRAKCSRVSASQGSGGANWSRKLA
jgi:hypothetical protein